MSDKSPMDKWVKPDSQKTDEQSEEQKEWQYVMDNLFNDENLHQKSELSRNLSVDLARLKVIEEQTGSQVAGMLAEWIMKYSISIKRQGRGESVQMMQSKQPEQDDEDTSYLKKLMGVR